MRQQCVFAARKAINFFWIELGTGSHHLQVDFVILPQHWRGHSWSPGSSPELPGTQGNENMEVSWTQHHEDVFGACDLHWEAEELALSILVKICRGILFMYTNSWWIWKLRIWSQAISLEKGQVVVCHYWDRKLHLNLRKKYNNESILTLEQVSQRSWAISTLRYSASWTFPWAACIWWHSSEQEGLDKTISNGPLKP